MAVGAGTELTMTGTVSVIGTTTESVVEILVVTPGNPLDGLTGMTVVTGMMTEVVTGVTATGLTAAPLLQVAASVDTKSELVAFATVISRM